MLKILPVKTAVFIVLWLVNASAAFSQRTPVKFTHITTKDGLSSNTVFDIKKDRHGFLWLATEDGLNKFDGTNFTVYRNDPRDSNSLGANYVRAIHEDKEGRIWAGTNGGSLCLYDPVKNSFINFRKKGLSTAITAIAHDADGNIWVTSYDGLYIIDPKTFGITRFLRPDNDKTQKSPQVLICVYKDSRQRMWLGGEEGLFLYNKKSKTFKHYSSGSGPRSLPNDYIMAIAEDKRGNIWIGSQGGLSMLLPDEKSFRNYRHSNTDPNTISSDLIYAIETENKDRLWIGTEEGVDILNITTGKVERYKPDNRDKNSLSRKSIRSILADKDNIVWLGAFQGGINKYDKNLTTFNLIESNPFDQRGLSAPIVTSFAEHKGKGVFVGTDGGGLNFFNPGTGMFNHYQLKSKRMGAENGLAVLGLEMTRSGHLWVATYLDGVFKLDPATGKYEQFLKGPGKKDLNLSDIFCIKEDRSGKIWIGTNGGGVNIYDPKDGTIEKYVYANAFNGNSDYPSSKVIRAFEEDREGRMWVGTFGMGISIWDPAVKKFSFLSQTNSGLSSNYVLSICEDRDGNMWIGTNGAGISLYNPKTGKFTTLTEKNGMPNNIVQKIVEDKEGAIWISTNNGISRYDKRKKSFTNFSPSNGLQNTPFVLGAGICLSNGQIFFGGQEGFNYFDPSFLELNKNIPPVVLTRLEIDSKPVFPSSNGSITQPIITADKINLKYRQNFTISFAALNFTNSHQNQYEYKLHGFDKQWIKAGKEHSATYTNLDPGEYEFQVRASNNNGIWNMQGRSIKLIVSPPFYRTIYAYIFYILAVSGLLFYSRYKGIQKLKMKFALEQERLQARQQIEQERRQAEHLRELDSMKIKFLTNLSHEFRTPISLIVGPVENLLNKIKEQELSGQLHLIKRNARRLLNLVNQLLDFRKMEEQELKLQLTEGEITGFIKEASDSFTDLAERKNINYYFSSNVKNTYVLFDADKIERILFNLISNAFKFTSEGGKITIELEQPERSSKDEKVWLTIKVADSGIGIPPETKDKIFETFYQNESGPKILNQGTGIGLSIAKEFVKMHNGTITVESEPGEGSCFIVTIPFTTAGDEPVEVNLLQDYDQEDEAVSSTENETLSIPADLTEDIPLLLIVEDDEDFRFYLKDNLKSTYRILEASNGKEGWQKALAGHPDIIVSDVNMPELDGIALGKKIRSDKRTKHIPLILLTASTKEDQQIRGLESGASDYMTKPFNFAVLNAKINNLLRLNQTFKETYTRQVKVVHDDIEVESENEKFLNKILVYIDKNISDPQLSVEALSQELVISRVSLYKKLLDLTGMSPVEFIRSVRLERAAILLEKSDLNIAQAAYSVGFSTPNYFAKSFKEKYNMTPSEYISRKRKNTTISID